MIVIFQGLPGAGKSLKLADTLIEVLYRNRSYYKKTGKIRPVYSNLRVSDFVEAEFKDFIHYYSDSRDLTALRDADVFVDEVSAYFNARMWENMSLESLRWLNQHRKFGVEIYGSTQDFAQVDKGFRRITSNLIHLTKIIGSADISPTKPPPKRIWGVVMMSTLDPTTYDEAKSKFNTQAVIPSFLFITRDLVSVFDTRQEIVMGKFAPLKHIERVCELDNCGFKKLIHA